MEHVRKRRGDRGEGIFLSSPISRFPGEDISDVLVLRSFLLSFGVAIFQSDV